MKLTFLSTLFLPATALMIAIPGFGADLSVTKATQPASLSLNTEGTSDWSHWGLNAATDWNHKSGITAQISNFTRIGTAAVNRYTDGTMANSWTGGTPTASTSSTKAGVYVAALGNGFQVTAPADTATRTLKVYCGVWKSRGKLEASLTDSSAPAVIDVSHESTTGSANTVFTINYSAASAGQKITVKWTVDFSHDAAGNGTVGWQAATLTTATTSNQSPQVSISSPVSGATFTAPATIPLNANASDPDGTISKVEFFQGSSLLGADTTSPYSITWSSVAAGAYTLTAKATDNANSATSSSAVNITVNSSSSSSSSGGGSAIEVIVDNTDSANVVITGAWVTSTSTAGYHGANYLHDDNVGKGTKSVKYTPSLTGSASYEVYLRWTSSSTRANNAPVDVIHAGGTTTVAVNQTLNGGSWQKIGTFTLNTGAGHHVVIRNGGTTGHVIADAVRFLPITNVSTGPTVSLTSPSNGASFTAPANITLAATASDGNGTVTKVDFLTGTSTIGSDSSSPFSVVWSGVAAGAYSLTAKASDNDGNVTTSSAVSVTVKASVSHSGGHPRLLFSAADVPGLRAKVTQPPYSEILEKIRTFPAEPNSNVLYTDAYRVRNQAALYILTGDTSYAEAAKTEILTWFNNSYWWNKDYKGLTRAAIASACAIAYDCCYDAWDATTRAKVSNELMKVADLCMSAGGFGLDNSGATANNHQGVRYGMSGLCYLASDEPNLQTKIDSAYTALKNHINAALGTSPTGKGWNPEGTGYILYPWQFMGPAAVAYKRLQGRDITVDCPQTSLSLWTTFICTLPLDRMSGSPSTMGKGLHPDWSDDNAVWHGEGSANLAFAVTRPSYIPGVKWMYDRLCGPLGDRSWDTFRGGGFYAILYYPASTLEQKPESIWGLPFQDPNFGISMFRNRYQDINDIISMHNAKARDGDPVKWDCHIGSDCNGFRIFGLGGAWTTGSGRTGDARGQTTVFATDPASSTFADSNNKSLGSMTSSLLRTQGDGYSIVLGSNTKVVNHKRRFVSDFSGLSGAKGFFVVADSSDNGRYWRLNTPEFNTVTTSTGGFTITGPNGSKLVGKVIYPANVSIRTGTFRRDNPNDPNSGGFQWGSTRYLNNKWLDFQSSNGQFVVALSLVESGASAPSVTSTGTGVNQTVRAGTQTITINGDAISASNW